MTGLAATFLGFVCDTEVSSLVLGEKLEWIRIQIEAVLGRLGQDKDMKGVIGKSGEPSGTQWN